MARVDTADQPMEPRSGPILQLIAAGLQVWIGSQCEAVQNLELQLHGTALQLLRGQLQGVSLSGQRVVYRGVAIESVHLRSEAIQVKVAALIRSKAVELDHPFIVRGQVSFSAGGLVETFRHSRWQALGDSLAEQLLGITPLADLRLTENTLIFSAHATGEHPELEIETRPCALDGSVGFVCLDGTLKLRLPMDPAIQIESACVQDGSLQLQGEALVSP
ncbi:DUF2993 domain-containing protein [Synechococcus sp. CS-602]|uniref:DUF2993 domain-containing protein n=1 Tax=Synechococcus sp. CS-602 TaxID=2847982 RepID=UPI00223BFE9E|nr:DUF2993 domain-containing protein [Synechococcus sp. CS-602]